MFSFRSLCANIERTKNINSYYFDFLVRPKMNNTYSFIMHDQVNDVVKSLMECDRRASFIRYFGQISIVAISVFSITGW